MKLLIPVDGSNNALRAVKYAISQRATYQQVPAILLLNVQWNIALGNIKLFISQQNIDDYYREQGEAALASARALLDTANVDYHYHISIGTPAEAIALYAAQQQVDQIIMGRQGQTSLQQLLLGSVVHKVLHLTPCPVLLVQ